MILTLFRLMKERVEQLQVQSYKKTGKQAYLPKNCIAIVIVVIYCFVSLNKLHQLC